MNPFQNIELFFIFVAEWVQIFLFFKGYISKTRNRKNLVFTRFRTLHDNLDQRMETALFGKVGGVCISLFSKCPILFPVTKIFFFFGGDLVPIEFFRCPRHHSSTVVRNIFFFWWRLSVD